MKELHAILKAFAESQQNAEPVFLATVVNVKGSSYRQPGARMLMTQSQILGTISGGCLENDVFQHTRSSMADGQPIVVTYDNNADEDIVWGFGLGCNGVVQVLIERLYQNDPLNPLAVINQCFCNQQQRIIATVFGVEGKVNIKVGARLILNPDRSVTTNIEESSLKFALIKDTQAALQNQHSSVIKYQLSSGSVDVLIEVIQPPTRLIIFGAGHDAVPVVQFAKALGWHVTIIDCRASEATKERFSMADEVFLTHREILHKQICVDEHTTAVVMTHNYLDDLEILKILLPSSIEYLGVLGPKYRTEKLLQDLRIQGINYSTEHLQKLYAPVGIDIGADTPEAIALSIIAEMQAVLKNRCGGFLRNRSEPIYQRHEVKQTEIEQLETGLRHKL
ncbi:MAG: XdhC family protein [Chlorogloeopsis fritschii C42_A2020_084]|uniref:XdhC family protein n=1 Tax=Chlorogloeopsis fritschii TaxID=1124 RepID=UPI0019DB4066|nr:XdhC/CoxI family protein [Chlorogloeopsis fritschii]MBF2005334.1 XdhC family protein [Chlorogloeopsis fritschii C42_A2020_084]